MPQGHAWRLFLVVFACEVYWRLEANVLPATLPVGFTTRTSCRAKPQGHYFFFAVFFLAAFLAAFFLATVTSSVRFGKACRRVVTRVANTPPCYKAGSPIAERPLCASVSIASMLVIARLGHMPTHYSYLTSLACQQCCHSKLA